MLVRGLVSTALALVALAAARAPVLEPRASNTPQSPEAASLPFYYDLYTFRATGRRTAVVAAVAVPVERLRGERTADHVRYRFDVRFVLADTARRSVERSLDSVFVSTPGPLPGQHLLHTYVEIAAPPSRATVHRVVVTDATRPGVGQLYSAAFTVPDYTGSRLMLSDLAFGLPDAAGGWTRGDVTLALLPTSQFPESAFDVYYEIYNLPAGNAYDTEVAIQPLDDDGHHPDAVVRTVFSGEANANANGVVPELRRVQSALPRGRYRITVTVRDKVTGREAERSRLVDVRGWGRGTTLVPSMPRGKRGEG